MDEAIKRQIGIWLLIVLGAFGAVLLEHINQLNWSTMWIFFIGIGWYASEGLLGFVIYHFFKVTKADIPVAQPILTKVETTPEIDPEAFTEAGVTAHEDDSSSE